MSHMQIGWIATAICAVISARCAREFFTDVPRFFSCLALLALAWTLLLPFYGELIKSPLLPGFGSFLLVYSGGLVRSEARLRASELDRVGVDMLSQLALLLLIPLAIPSVPFGIVGALRAEQVQLGAATVLGAVGYIALWYGVKALRPHVVGLYIGITVITIVYVLLEVIFLASKFGSIATTKVLVMSEPMAYGFTATKIALTIVFAYALIRYHEPKITVGKVIVRFIGIRPVPEISPAAVDLSQVMHEAPNHREEHVAPPV